MARWTKPVKRTAVPKVNWHIFKPWEVGGLHDSFVTPGTRKLQTPEGLILAIISPLMGGRHAAKYPEGTCGTSFTVQHGNRCWMGWAIAEGGGPVAPFPDKAFAAALMARLRRRGAFRG